MTQESPQSAVLPILAAGGLGGIVASLFCFCWVVSLPAGAFAVRWAARERGGRLPGGSAVGIGLMTGLILGAITASLGTALFLSFMDPDAMAEAMLSESSEVSIGMVAVSHAMVAFFANLTLGVFGAMLGAAALPAPSDEDLSLEPAAPAPAYRFEPPRGWQAPEPSSPPALDDSFDEVPREAVTPEAFQSAWRSKAASGTPRPARKQAPPYEDMAAQDEEESEEPTLDGQDPPVSGE